MPHVDSFDNPVVLGIAELAVKEGLRLREKAREEEKSWHG